MLSLISYVIRNYFLPNPFIYISKYPELLNIIAGGIFIPLSYILTGLASRFDTRALRTLLFFINYATITFILLEISKICSILWLTIVLFILVYIGLCYLESRLLSD